MSHVIVFHHVQGLTGDVHGIADVQELGFDTIIERGRQAAGAGG